MLQRGRKYLRERRRRKKYLRLVRERLTYMGLFGNVALRQDWEILDFLAGIGGAHVEALCRAKRNQEMMDAARERRGDPKLN